MAQEDKHQKTEKPTPKRKKEAREKGQVARSMDVAAWAGTVVASFLMPWFLHLVSGKILGVLAQATQVGRHPTPQGALLVLEAGLKVVLLTVGPLGAAMALVGIVANVAQTGRAFSLKAARPKLSRISPRAGIRNLFSPQNGMALVKQVVKLLLLVGVAYQAINQIIHEMVGLRPVSLLPLLAATAQSVLSFVRIVSLLGLVVGLADFFYQRHKLLQGMKMTKHEVKEESKAAEGDPHVKGMIRKRMYQIARSQLLAAVHNADVVVTNPTHYAVALRYEAGRSAAPRVVAKGADLLAKRIREEAATCEIPVVEDPPLARYLYAVCDVDEAIPAEIFAAVARLLAFVYSLPANLRGVGVHHLGGSILPAEPAALARLTEAQQTRARTVLSGAAAT